jgi:protein-tyrosine phosphatase
MAMRLRMSRACCATAVDLNWITPELAVGACFPAREVESIALVHKLRAVVDLRADSCDGEIEVNEDGIAVLRLPVIDDAGVAPDTLRAAVGFATRYIDAGERVLLHCYHGIGRSALLGLCVLVELGYSPMRALELAKTNRKKVSPNPAQYDAWARWLRDRRLEVPSFAAFSRIAQRHLST